MNWAPLCRGLSTAGRGTGGLHRQRRQAGDVSKAPRRHEVDQHRLLRVQPVLSLIEDHGLRAVNDLSSLLHAPGRGQAVHEDAVLLGLGEKGLVHLEWHEHILARLLLFLGDAVAHPAVAVDDIDILDCLLSRLAHLNLGASLVRHLLDLLPDRGLNLASTRHVQVVANKGSSPHQIIGDIVLQVAKVSHREALALPLVLDDREQISKHLHRVAVVIQRVHHRDRGDGRKGAHSLPAHDAGSDALHHARKDPARVLDALLLAQGAVTDGVEEHLAAKLVHANLQGHACAKGWLLEEGQQGVALEHLGEAVVARVQKRLRGGLHGNRDPHDVQDLILRQVAHRQQVLG
mmetsp:Transcript_92525/g.238873  ORF Transcript_92525/g.238873 Transcript_92525/m.238873 type:complete len:347 (-) Transcript_92525:161-1201(-)